MFFFPVLGLTPCLACLLGGRRGCLSAVLFSRCTGSPGKGPTPGRCLGFQVALIGLELGKGVV